MDEQLNLTLNAIDKLQAFDKMLDSLNKIDSSINKLNSNIMEMGNNVRKQEGFWVKLSSQINIAKNAIGGLKTVLGGVTGLLGKGLEVGKSFFGQIVGAAQYKQNTLATLETFLGSRELANDEINKILSIAGKTPADTEPLMDLTRILLTSGYKREEVESLRAAGADIQALFGSNEKMMQYVEAMSKLKGEGKLTGETRQSLNLVGIGSEELNKQLGILLKIKGTQEQVTKEVLKRQKAGLITDKIAARAIEETLKSRLNEKNLGEFSMKMASSSLSGAVSNFENAFNDTLKSLNFDDSPGIAAFRQVLNNLTDVIKSPEFKNAINDLMESLFGGFKEIDKGKIDWFFNNVVLEGLRDAEKIVSRVWLFIKDIINGNFGTIAKDALIGMKDVFIYIGALIGKGIYAAITGSGSDVISKFEENNKKVVAQSVPPIPIGSDGLPDTGNYGFKGNKLEIVGLNNKTSPSITVGDVYIHGNNMTNEDVGKVIASETVKVQDEQSKKDRLKRGR